jgi:polyhydroxyalkanoate synthesis regulator protein
LLQIILEEETAGIPLFSEQILAHIIRFYGHAMQGFVGAHLEKNMQALIDVQQQLSTSTPSMNAEAWSQLMSIGNPLMPNALSTYLEKSQTTLNQMQEQMLSVMGLKR